MSVGKPFEPGNPFRFNPKQSGNPAGRPKANHRQRLGKLMDDVLKHKLKENDGYLAEVLATALIKSARKGSLKAIEMIFERTQGKPQQSLNLKTDEAPTVKDIDERINELFERAAARENDARGENATPRIDGDSGENGSVQ